MIMTVLFEKNLPIPEPAVQNGLFLQPRYIFSRFCLFAVSVCGFGNAVHKHAPCRGQKFDRRHFNLGCLFSLATLL